MSINRTELSVANLSISSLNLCTSASPLGHELHRYILQSLFFSFIDVIRSFDKHFCVV